MEKMSTCLDKLLRQMQEPIPENILGKMAVAVSSFVSQPVSPSLIFTKC